MIYFDFAATSPVKEEVVNIITDTLKDNYGNPSSIYKYGVESRRIIDTSREIVRRFINADVNDKIIFTSGACESNSTVICGIPDNYIVLSTEIEHTSTIKALKKTKNYNDNQIIKVNNLGQIDLIDLDDKLKKIKENNNYIPLFCYVCANNEIGTIQNITKINDIVHKNGGKIYIDATQYIGLNQINVQNMNIDMLGFSGQKFGAPKGIGILYIKDGIKVDSLICGSQENGLRGGTENVPYIAGIGKAIELIDYSKNNEIENLRNYCWAELCKIADKNNVKFKLNGDPLHRLSNNLNFQVPCLDSQQILAIMDLGDICISSGSACNSYNKETSHVLKAIGLSEKEANLSIRLTFGENNTKEEIDEFVNKMDFILNQFL